MPLRPGLTSITHRQLTPNDIIDLATRAHLQTIEWGADVHLPPGNSAAARDLCSRCADAGLNCPSYGTYFRAGEDDPDEFSDLVNTAHLLGARQLRIWAGRVGSTTATAEQFDATVRATQHAADIAAAHGISVCFEFHDNTLNDTAPASRALIDAIDRANVATYWQPPVGLSDHDAAEQLAQLLDRVTTVHVFSWSPDHRRLPLAARETLWQRVFDLLEDTARRHDVLLEHVPDDDPHATVRDAATLRSWCAAAATPGRG